jgi:hypothetical protein
MNMSDIDNQSYGRETSSWDGIRASLTEMERRLGELQDQLDPRARATGVHGAIHAVPAAGIVGGAPGLAGAAAATTGFVPPPFGSDPAARQSAEEILAQARTAAREVLAMAEAQVGLVKEQIEQLLQARETLRGSLRTALADCEGALQRLERGERSAAPSPDGWIGQPPRHPAGERLLLGERPSIQRPTGAGGTIAVGVPFAPSLEQPSVYEGSVSLRVGPLRDISQVDTLEIALLQVPGAEQVEVKEFAGRDAVAIIKLFQPVPLVEELRRVLPFQFEVAEGRADALTLIAVEDGESGRQNDAAGSLPQVGIE